MFRGKTDGDRWMLIYVYTVENQDFQGILKVYYVGLDAYKVQMHKLKGRYWKNLRRRRRGRK